MKAHCLFEQSGTFKNEFIKLGIDAEDYDLQDKFGETDHVIDLFEEIQKGYKKEPSIFDEINKDDMVMAFFPCTRFAAYNGLHMRGQTPQQKNYDISTKLKLDLKIHKELSRNYELITKLALISIERGFKMIIENPYTQPHYLTYFWALRPAIIDKDRRKSGDYYKKPTQYFFVNFEPKQTRLFEPLEEVEQKIVAYCSGPDRETKRSMIHPQYARRFIKQYLI